MNPSAKRRAAPQAFLRSQRLGATQLAVLALLAATSVAQAQTAGDAAAPAAIPADASAAPAAAGAANQLPVVVVTATKKTTSLQRTPVAVTAISGSTLDDAHALRLLDVMNLVPSMQGTDEGDHGITSITLRGIGNDSAKTEYADPEVALFVDGVFSPRPEGASTMMFDLDSVEVLRGPQGTLWGRNSTVGAINMQSAKPVLKDQSGYVEGGIGSYDRMGVKGALNIPLSDTVAMRVAFTHEQHDGYVAYQTPVIPSLASQQAAYNAAYPGTTPANTGPGFQPLNSNLFVTSGQKYNAQDQSAARVSLLVKPSENLQWNVSLEEFRDRGTPAMNLMQTPRSGEPFWSALIDTAPSLKRDSTNLRSRLEYDFDTMSLAYVAGVNRYTGAGTYDQDFGVQMPTSFTTGATHQEDTTDWAKYNSYSHEVTLQSTGKRNVDWLLGLYYAAEDNGIRFDIPIMNGTQQGTVSWQGSFIQPKETVNSEAAFSQVTFNATDALHFTGGIRFTKDKRTNVGGIGWGWAGDASAPQVPVNASIDPTNPANGFAVSTHNDAVYNSSKTTWLLRTNYDINKDTMTYASVSTGYKSGGTGDGGVPYGPETLTNYEIGLKSAWLDHRMTVNLAAYYMDFKDFQFSAPITNPDGSHAFAYSNAKGAKVSGLEAEVQALVTDSDHLTLTGSLAHTKLGELIGSSNDYQLPACTVPGLIGTNCLDVTGHELPHAPKFSMQLLYEHDFELNNGATLAPRISAHYQTDTWLSVFNLGSGDQQKAYATADVGLRYQGPKNWYVDGYVHNVSDARIKTSAGSAGTYANPIWVAQYMPPRIFGINAGYTF